MSKKIHKIHVSFGNWSTIYRVGDQIDGSDFGAITRIEYDQFDSIEYDTLTYNIYAEVESEEKDEALAKKIQGLPVELSYYK